MNMSDIGRGGNFCFGYAGLTAGTTTTLTTANAVSYSNAGRMYTKAAVTNGASPTTDAKTGAAFVGLVAGDACIFVVGLDVSGNIKVVQGPVVSGTDVSGDISAVQFPEMPDSVTPIGYLYAVAGSTLSGTWTFGSSNNSSVTGMTYNWRSLFSIPADPIVA